MRLLLEDDPIIGFLNVAVHDYATYRDKYVKVIVRDALILREHPERRFEVTTEVFRYSSLLSEEKQHILNRLNPDNLGLKDYRTLLDFFESL